MEYKQALKTVRKYGAKMLTTPESNVQLVAVGSKDAGPISEVKDFSVVAYVKKKLTKKELKGHGVESFDKIYSSTVSGAPPEKMDIDVVECGAPFEPMVGFQAPAVQRGLFGGNPPALNAQKWFVSLRSGIGITNPTGEYPQGLSVGTLGFYLDDDDENQYLVSNNHVIGRSNEANAGESIVQPGTLDLTGLELQLMNTLARLRTRTQVARVSAVVTLDFLSGSNIPVNRVDAAMGELTDSGRALSELPRLTFGGAIRGVAAPYRIDATGSIQGSARVYKVGRTTGYTEGRVVGLAGTAAIDYPGGTAFFADQIVVRGTPDNVGPFSDRGDSGSGVLSDRHELVGLLFAGSARQTLVNPIAAVVDQLRNASGIQSLNVITV